MGPIKWWMCLLLFSYVKPSNEYNWNYITIRNETVPDYMAFPINYDPLCPGIGEECDSCCQSQEQRNVICYNSKCQVCYEDNWRCSSHVQNQNLLLTATQIAMSAALILGIVTIFALFWKICAGNNQTIFSRRHNRPGERNSTRSGRSVDALQQIVSERLRDAPPPYSRSILPPPGDTPPPYIALPSPGNVNLCFDPDYNAAPPSYNTIATQPTPVTENESDKTDTETNENLPAVERTLHM